MFSLDNASSPRSSRQRAARQSSFERAISCALCKASECSAHSARRASQTGCGDRAREMFEPRSAAHLVKRTRTAHGLVCEPHAAPRRARGVHVCQPSSRSSRALRVRLPLPPPLHLVEWQPHDRQNPPPSSPSSPSSPSWPDAVAPQCQSVASLPVARSTRPSASSNPQDRRSAADDWRAPARARSDRVAQRRQ